jgi:RHH-type proline utilization regulon transcriptional repressor/proline dehydrogenase/delta 1-pyrroline-5-carboxylate dehydrogenase
VLQSLPASVRERVSLAQDWAAPAVHFDAVLHSGAAEALRAMLAALAQRPGPIISATATRCGEPVPLQRLVIERSLSINTAAAGGNASLMMLG